MKPQDQANDLANNYGKNPRIQYWTSLYSKRLNEVTREELRRANEIAGKVLKEDDPYYELTTLGDRIDYLANFFGDYD